MNAEAGTYPAWPAESGRTVALARGDRTELSVADLEAKMRRGGRRSPDAVSITVDGRRLDSKRAVLDWWADVGAERAVGRRADFGDEQG